MSKPVVLITGALTGIGRATAVAFAREGARLIVSGRREAEGQELARGLRSLDTEAEFVKTDVRKEEDVRRLHRYSRRALRTARRRRQQCRNGGPVGSTH